MTQYLNGAFGLRKRNSEAEIKLALEFGEIGLDASTDTIWFKNYAGGFMQIAGSTANVNSIQNLRDIVYSATPQALVYVSGYYSIGDMGGGYFYWDAESTDDDDGGITFLLTGWVGPGRYKRILNGSVLITQFGAHTSFEDNTPFIQACVDSCSGQAFGGSTVSANAQAGRACVVVPGGQYICTGTLKFPQRRMTFTGLTAEQSILRHLPEVPFTNLIEIDTNGNGNIIIENLSLRGRDFNEGDTKYLIYAENLNENSAIRKVWMRNSVGMLRIELGYLCDIDIRCSYSTYNLEDAGITYTQWEEIWGEGNAPIWLGAMNACVVSIRTFRIGSESVLNDALETVNPWTPIYIGPCGGLNIPTINLEWGQYHNEGIIEDGNNYDLITTHGMVFDGCGGNVDGISIETMKTGLGGVVAFFPGGGGRAINISSLAIYGCQSASYVILNRAGFDPFIASLYVYDQLGGELLKTFDSAISESNDVKVMSGSMMTGKRCRQTLLNGGPNDDNDNVSDTYEGTGDSLLGVPDTRPDPNDPVKSRSLQFAGLTTPKIISGYVVTKGANPVYNSIDPTESEGEYIEVTCGVMRLSSGNFAVLKKLTDAPTGNKAVQRIRPSEASKYYKIYIGRLGQPYLVKFDSDNTIVNPEGDWIASFSTNGSNEIGTVTANPRLNYYGRYSDNGLFVTILGTAAPTTGFWKVGDRCENTNPSSNNILCWICISAGTPGTWQAISDDSISNPMAALGDLTYGGASGVRTRLPGNTTAVKKFLRETGNGTVSAAPAWDTLVESDIPTSLPNLTAVGILTALISSGGIQITGGTEAVGKILKSASKGLTIQAVGGSSYDISILAPGGGTNYIFRVNTGTLVGVFPNGLRAGASFSIDDAHTPASASASGVAGRVCWDANYIYICTATNTWKRVAISSW